MPIVVTIGYTRWLLKKDSDAVKILTALAGAVRLESKYLEGGRSVYWPDDRHSGEVKMETILARDILRGDPAEQEAEVFAHPPRRQIQG